MARMPPPPSGGETCWCSSCRGRQAGRQARHDIRAAKKVGHPPPGQVTAPRLRSPLVRLLNQTTVKSQATLSCLRQFWTNTVQPTQMKISTMILCVDIPGIPFCINIVKKVQYSTCQCKTDAGYFITACTRWTAESSMAG